MLGVLSEGSGEDSIMTPVLRTALALGLSMSAQRLAPAAYAQDPQEILPCRVGQGQTTVAVGRMSLSACLRSIHARFGTGTWGPKEIAIDQGGVVRIDGEARGVLRPHDGSIEDIQRQ
jgi:hypothetical protein